MTRPFNSLLIANRGEIACRVIRTARAMGLRTNAVYSEADRAALHVQMADSAVFIGPAAARESYLNIEAILAAAMASGAEAIHPGYGFLSEKAEFAEAVSAAGLVFVGPPASSIRAMGLKDAAKTIAREAGVPVVPGYQGEDQSLQRLSEEGARLGFPVLIKAVAGGGGKGMRRVDRVEDFARALEGAQREASAAFGDARVLIEKYIAQPRHIEFQIFADTYGNVIHLGERDCSVQRRHQKVIEEAPAPGMSAALRDVMGAAAVKVAKAIGYAGAGTIEFIADGSRGLREDGFYFMEMNTRLQVEHPVTEAITGEDLVALQLRVAMGGSVPAQSDVKFSGAAIEARLYAEDPDKGFLPSTGTLTHFEIPAGGVRADTGVRTGDSVTMFYDPMLAKLIAHGDTRDEARLRLASALEQTRVAGLRTNAAFAARVLRHEAFARGEADTGFIDRHLAALTPKSDGVPQDVIQAAACGVVLAARAAARAHQLSPWDELDGFRVGGKIWPTVAFEQGAAAGDPDLGELSGRMLTITRARLRKTYVFLLDGRAVTLIDGAETWRLRLADPMDVELAQEAAGDSIAAPMPGRIVQMLVKPGDLVKRGQPLAVLEAMKMEHTLTAPADVTIARAPFAPGDQVSEGAVIIAFESAA